MTVPVYTPNTNYSEQQWPSMAKLLAEHSWKEVDYLEIGCWEGQTTRWLLEQNPKCIVTVVDTFFGSPEIPQVGGQKSRFLHNVDEFRGRVFVRHGESRIELRRIDVQFQFDFIYVDGSHECHNVLEDSVLAWHLLKTGGILLWDDYGWGPGPKMAVDAFLTCYGGRYEELLRGWQIGVRKLK